jgi:hypothetical protein
MATSLWKKKNIKLLDTTIKEIESLFNQVVGKGFGRFG